MRSSIRRTIQLAAIAVAGSLARPADADSCGVSQKTVFFGAGCCGGASSECDAYGYQTTVTCKGSCAVDCCCMTSDTIVRTYEYWDCSGACPEVTCVVSSHTYIDSLVPATCGCICSCPN